MYYVIVINLRKQKYENIEKCPLKKSVYFQISCLPQGSGLWGSPGSPTAWCPCSHSLLEGEPGSCGFSKIFAFSATVTLVMLYPSQPSDSNSRCDKRPKHLNHHIFILELSVTRVTQGQQVTEEI